MASSDMASQFSETVNSLDLDTVPDKLKCAICSKLALNAFKLPCCGQSICDTCQKSLPASCPVCEHSPVTPEMCTPHKALRNTLKAYLKTAEKRLAEERSKSEALKAPPATTPIDPPANTSLPPTPDVKPDEKESSHTSEPPSNTRPATSDGLRPQSGEFEQRKQSMNGTTDLLSGQPIGSPTARPADMNSSDTPATGEGQRSRSEPSSQAGEVQKITDQSSGQSPIFPNGLNSGSGQMGGFPNLQNPNMGLGNMDYNQILQNGIPGGMNFGMMGAPGMNLLDPMAQMSQMYGGFGGSNMGVGINGMGMNFNANQGAYGGWNGQNNMWQGMQNMNNQNSLTHGMGDFGSNSGYGYNFPHQGNFQQQQYPNNEFQSGHFGHGFGRGGRGRGRGYGRGRGAFNNFQSHGNMSNYQQSYSANRQQNSPPTEAQVSSEPTDRDQRIDPPKTANGEITKTLDEEFAPGGLDDVREVFVSNDTKEPPTNTGPENESNETKPSLETTNHQPEDISKEISETNGHTETTLVEPGPDGPTAQDEPRKSVSIPVADTTMTDVPMAMPPPSAPLGPAAQFSDPSKDFGFRGRGRGGFVGRGRGYINGSAHVTTRPEAPPNAPTEPKGQGVVGAPTGPKAMRPGFVAPSARGRGMGIQIVGRAAMAGREVQSQGLETAKSESSPKLRERSRTRSRSRSRSPSHRSHRHRYRDRESNYRSETEDDRERRREQRHRRSKREDDYYDDDTHVNGDGDYSASSDLEHSSRRKNREKSSRSSHTHRSSHRSRRHRSRSRDEDHCEDEDHHHSSDLRSGVDKDVSSSVVESENRANGHRRHKHRSSHHDESHDSHRDRKRSRRDYEHDDHDVNRTEDEPRSTRQKRDEEIKVPTEPGSMASQKIAEPEKDPHALEREARNRERMLKEQQRRDATNAEVSKRRDSRHERAFGGRRVSYKFEASPSRIEQEREAVRWR